MTDKRTKAELLKVIYDLEEKNKKLRGENDRLFTDKVALHQEAQNQRRAGATVSEKLNRVTAWGNIAYNRAEHNKKIVNQMAQTISDFLKFCPTYVGVCPRCGTIVHIEGDKPDHYKEKMVVADEFLCAKCFEDEPFDERNYSLVGPNSEKVEFKCSYVLAGGKED